MRHRVRAREAFRSPLVVIAALVLAATAALASMPDRSDAAATAGPQPPAASIPALGQRWFALGANVPWVEYRCDFGCGLQRGVRGRQAEVDAMLRKMSRRGVRTVRWYLFADDAWQLRRTADGTPTSVSPAALLDLDIAVRLAARNDVFLLPVVLPDPSRVPATWFTDPAQSRALAAALSPMFARYRSQPHLLGWELATGAETLLDAGTATGPELRAHVADLRAALRAAAPRTLAAIGTTDVSRIDTWTGLGADLYTPQSVSGQVGERCATCRSVGALVAAEGVDAPVVIGGFDAPTDAIGAQRLARFSRLGYAGALAFSWHAVPHPLLPGQRAPMPDDATWRFADAHPRSGPRSRPANPCYGPREATFRCPNLKMATPSNLSLGHRGGRTVLFSRNSLDSRGAGPASLHGLRNGTFTMAAKQVLHRVHGAPLAIDTGARLLFKAVPGQYRYWKWNGAARMELWRLDSTGHLVERTRIGPKTVYCLRDLQRTKGSLPRSPRSRVFPACSQRLKQGSVTLGTSVGWSDIYPASYNENWIDVTGLRGCFAYVHVADPLNVIYESNEDDNASKVVVRLPWTGSNAGCPGARPVPTIGANGTY
ncbi:MAG: hypothetical protein JWM98_798 [Thermoleophilia bacterium]|nr:hypothetical protein [Thermoleophilia bacterium]